MKDSIKRYFAFRQLIFGYQLKWQSIVVFICVASIAMALIFPAGFNMLGVAGIIPMIYCDSILQLELRSAVYNLKKYLPIEAKTYRRQIWINWLLPSVFGIFVVVLLTLFYTKDFNVALLWIVFSGLILPNSLIIFNAGKSKKYALVFALAVVFVRLAQWITMNTIYSYHNLSGDWGTGEITYIDYIAWAIVALGFILSIFGLVAFVGKVGQIREINYDEEGKSQAIRKSKQGSNVFCSNETREENTVKIKTSWRRTLFGERTTKKMRPAAALRPYIWRKSKGETFIMISVFICYPIYRGIMGFGNGERDPAVINGEPDIIGMDAILSFLLLYGCCTLLFQNVFSVLGRQESSISFLPVDLGRFVRRKVASYMLALVVAISALFVVETCMPYKGIGFDTLVHKAIAFGIFMIITVICGCMKTTVEATGAMICAQVLSMIAMALYMFLEENFAPIIYVGYLSVYFGILFGVMILLISKRVKKKNGIFG